MILMKSFEQVLEWHKTITHFAKTLFLYNCEWCNQERYKRSKSVALRNLKTQMCGAGDIKDWTGDPVATSSSAAGDAGRGKSVLGGTLLSAEPSRGSEGQHRPGQCCSRLCPRCLLPDKGTSRTSPWTVSRWWAAGKTGAVSEAGWGFAAVEEQTHQRISTRCLKLCWCSGCAG